MDAQTLAYYSGHAQDLALRYEAVPSVLADRFASSFAPGGKILDIGCGSGRDLAELARQGFQPFGLDGAPEWVQLAQQLHPELLGRIQHGVLPDLSVPFGGEFDGVLCCAVLMHIDSAELFNAALAIKRCLKVHGRLLISVPTQRADANDQDRDAHGRLFKTYHPGFLRLMFERLGFSLLDQWTNTDSLERQGVGWVSLLFQLQSGPTPDPSIRLKGC